MPADSSPAYDVVVAGGGPAGACVATVVAQAGHRVLLLERAAEPGFKIGESLMPATYWTLERLGVLEKMKCSHFTSKYSVQFFSRGVRPSAPFYFFENDSHESSRTWQVLRSEFDQLLLDNAADNGVEVRRGVSVADVLFDDAGRAVGVVAEAGGEASEIGARVVVDATGQSTLLASKLRLKEQEPRLKNASLFTHYAGGRRDEGVDEGATLILHTEHHDSWFWYIPLPEDRVSVGVVGPVDYLVKGRGGSPQEIFDEELALCPAVAERLAGAEQLYPVRAIRDFSYSARQAAGDGWVLVGDAFGFIDPIYSSGVFLALKSGEMAADAIVEGFEKGDLSAAQLGSFAECYAHGVEAMRKLVYAFYDKDFSFAELMRRHPECRRQLVNLLIGNVYREPVDGLFEAMEEMISLPEAAPLAGAAPGAEG